MSVAVTRRMEGASLRFMFHQKCEDKLPERSNKHTICNACAASHRNAMKSERKKLKVGENTIMKISELQIFHYFNAGISVYCSKGLFLSHYFWWIKL